MSTIESMQASQNESFSELDRLNKAPTPLQILIKNAESLAAIEECVEHNSGTFAGDPQFDGYEIYESVAGKRRIVGHDPKTAPGRPRKSYEAVGRLLVRRRELAELQKQIERMAH